LVKRFDEAALRVEALEQELSKLPNADPFIAERQAKFRAMAEEMERAKADVEIVRKHVEALQVPQEGEAYHNRVLEWVRGMEDYFPAQKKFYENSATFWTEKRDAGAWAAYSLQLRQADELRKHLKKEIGRIDQGRRELAEQFGLPSVATR
jgi:DNA repair exonuclease SbcCD ATPase subunit